MKNCVNIQWRNGFGNQLFQYSFARLLAEENDCELTYSGFGRVCFASLLDYGFITEPNHITKYSSEKHNILKTIDYDGDIIYDYLDAMGLTADVPHARLSESYIKNLIRESIERNLK